MLTTLLAASAATLVAAPAAGLLGYRQLKRHNAATRLRIDTTRGIDESGFVRIGGIDQWISIRGDNLANPVVMEIHGGPGASNSIFIPRTRDWEKHFTIVRWDMRGAGKTFGRNGAGPLGFARMYADAVEVAQHIRHRMGVDKLVLVGNSFGSVFGLRLARQYPQWFSAYVGTDQNIMDGGRDRSGYHALLERVTNSGKKKDAAQLRAMGPDAHQWTAHQWAQVAKLTVTTDPLTFDTMKTVVVRSLWFSPLHSLRELGHFFKGMNHSEQMTIETVAFDDYADGTDFAVPFFVFQGEHDVLTPPSAAREFFDRVNAPVKDFALINGASHFASFREPGQFLELMLTRVKPAIERQRLVTD
ncbi:MAG TPA: alpha/beta hydrolase [Stackebrandtia sp.]|jgi:pimeloyl-ACP methyl ester carboxylesterase|uniref:alpha/beta fold hydrolase n=1 Tax=Stackebrandtia sp. TaxID=2023065 RepID=UPI002D72325C|nr:alpha/beta hydrolase [Stackebrandtia sp.]HZE39682.1 alpha/beta hydrolase [Stackebrandtia sp.]